jgi:undecaprenyl diphosphate synthase
MTKDKKGLTLLIAVSYGGRDEITRAVKEICKQTQKGAVQIESIDEALISRYLETKGIPDPDLIIRTSGEMRTSNFLIWQSAYSEYCIKEKYWPDYNIEDFKQDIADFQSRDRRFGNA